MTGDEEVKKDMDMWKHTIQQDINQLKTEQEVIKKNITNLEMSDKLQNQEIQMLKEILTGISEDTKWIRRKITSAIITAIITGLIGGVIAFFFAQF